jgi:hypothetical protein
MILEIRVPISPKPFFFKQVEYLYKSVMESAGQTYKVKMVISVGEDMDPYDIGATQSWTDKNVSWRWVPREDFRRFSYHATGLDRFFVESDSDFVLMADADTIFIRGVDDLLLSLSELPSIAGVIAHVPPFLGQTNVTWKSFFEGLGRKLPKDLHQHTGWGTMFHDPKLRFGPAYYNFGAIFIPKAMMPDLAMKYATNVSKMSYDVGYFQGQMALALSIHDLDLPHITLDPRYNFPNDPRFEQSYPRDLSDVRILHYLRLDEIQRDKIWENLPVFLARRDLRPSNERLRSRIQFLMDWRMP